MGTPPPRPPPEPPKETEVIVTDKAIVLPEKIRLAKEYVASHSLRLDVAILFGTAIRLACDHIVRPGGRRKASEKV